MRCLLVLPLFSRLLILCQIFSEKMCKTLALARIRMIWVSWRSISKVISFFNHLLAKSGKRRCGTEDFLPPPLLSLVITSHHPNSIVVLQVAWRILIGVFLKNYQTGKQLENAFQNSCFHCHWDKRDTWFWKPLSLSGLILLKHSWNNQC